MDGPFLPDTFTICDDACAIATFLILQDPESRFAFIAQARIAYLLQQPPLLHRGARADAVIARAGVQGQHHLLFEFLTAVQADPLRFPVDFVIYVDAAAWSRRALHPEVGASGFPILREALIYHELSHVRQLSTEDGEPRFSEDGRPLLALTHHTYEFFQTEVTRYGPKTLSLEQVGLDLAAGRTAELRRERRGRLRAV